MIFNCRMSDPNVRVKLKQKASSGVFVERFTDGCRVSRRGQTFVIHAVNFNDLGIYYCEAPHVKIRRKEEAYLKVNPGKVRTEFSSWRRRERSHLCNDAIQIPGVIGHISLILLGRFRLYVQFSGARPEPLLEPMANRTGLASGYMVPFQTDVVWFQKFHSCYFTGCI